VCENDNCHGESTKKVVEKSWKGMPEEESLEETSENRHRRRRCNMLWQDILTRTIHQ